MQLLHGFEEERSSGFADHMTHWFGRLRACDAVDEGEFPVVCFCGGRLEPLVVDGKDVVLGVVWHLSKFVRDVS
jgi:hypothetical protein